MKPGAGAELDWTRGPAKWAAVLALGAASIFGMAWSITMRRPMAMVAPASGEDAAPVDPPSQPGRVILREEPAAPAPGSPASERGPGRSAPMAKLNLNTATAAELELLPGIGPALAGRIVADREANGPFKAVSDIDRVRGIGPKILDRLDDFCTVE